MATCPKCRNTPLRHTLVTDHLAAHSCSGCKGLLVSLVAYRKWSESHDHTPSADESVEIIDETQDTKTAVACSRCQTVMTKYRISARTENRIDYCASCEDIWLDGGEWELISALVGSRHLARIFTQPWQHRIRSETVEIMQSNRLESLFGEEFDKILGIKKWLDDHSIREEIIAYLQRKSG